MALVAVRVARMERSHRGCGGERNAGPPRIAPSGRAKARPLVSIQATRCILAAVLSIAALGAAIAQDIEFYKGRTITIVVGYSAGGGYDQYSRLLARFLGRHVPGNPAVVVQNLPGAASLTAARYVANTAPKDGTAIANFDPGLILEALAYPDKINVRFADYQWLGSMSREVPICYAWHATGIKTFADMMSRKEFLIGLTARGSNAYVNGATLRRVFKAPIRQIAGYPGSNEQRLAIERGELEGACASWSAIPPDWVANHKVNPLAKFSPLQPPDMPSTPYVNDLAATQEQKNLLDLLNSPAELGRPYVLANEVPPTRAKILSAAFEAAVNDPALLAEAQKQSLPIDLLTGAEAQHIIDQMYSASPALVQKAKDVIDLP
jgi:tripartite-type tricarboxylate transporter receptor subunit TctC